MLLGNIMIVTYIRVSNTTTTRIIVDQASKIESRYKAAVLTSQGMNGISSDVAERTEQPRPLASTL